MHPLTFHFLTWDKLWRCMWCIVSCCLPDTSHTEVTKTELYQSKLSYISPARGPPALRSTSDTEPEPGHRDSPRLKLKYTMKINNCVFFLHTSLLIGCLSITSYIIICPMSIYIFNMKIICHFCCSKSLFNP